MVNNFDNEDVKMVSHYLQYYMRKNSIKSMSADECAILLSESKIVSNEVGPKQGFNFRQMLREGRDGKIDLVVGAEQKQPNTRWKIRNVNSDSP